MTATRQICVRIRDRPFDAKDFNVLTTTNFTELGLIEPLTRALAAQDYIKPTPIQEKAVPQILSNTIFSALHKPVAVRRRHLCCQSSNI